MKHEKNNDNLQSTIKFNKILNVILLISFISYQILLVHQIITYEMSPFEMFLIIVLELIIIILIVNIITNSKKMEEIIKKRKILYLN